MSKTIKIKTIGRYNGHSFKPTGAVELKLKMSYDELIDYYYQLPLLRSVDTTIITKVEAEPAQQLGTFMLKSFMMDHDGEGTVTFNSQYDFVEANALNDLVGKKDSIIKLLFRAEIEEENTEE